MYPTRSCIPPLSAGWEKLFTEDGVPFWTNHNERTTSWDPPTPLPTSAAAGAAKTSSTLPGPVGADATTVVGVVAEAKGIRQSSLGESEVFESAEDVAEAAAIGVPVENVGQVVRHLGADGRPLPEGKQGGGVTQNVDRGGCFFFFS